MENTLENAIDVRIIESMHKHRRIFERFDELEPGQSLLIVNDHDPKPLYYQLLAERGNIFDWQYIMNGPEEWRVNITLRLNTSEESIGQIAAKDIKKVEVFKKFGIDFCCGGKKTLAQVCEEKGLDRTEVEKELNATQATKVQLDKNYNDFPIGFLCDYIVNVHHAYVKKTLPMLMEVMEKVANKHGNTNPQLLRIQSLMKAVNTELLIHMQKEELILFPYIKQEPISDVREPILMMEMEHESVGALFDEIQLFTNDFHPPANACNSYQLLYHTLKEFNDDLHVHIHLENNILFPRALAKLQ